MIFYSFGKNITNVGNYGSGYGDGSGWGNGYGYNLRHSYEHSSINGIIYSYGNGNGFNPTLFSI